MAKFHHPLNSSGPVIFSRMASPHSICSLHNLTDRRRRHLLPSLSRIPCSGIPAAPFSACKISIRLDAQIISGSRQIIGHILHFGNSDNLSNNTPYWHLFESARLSLYPQTTVPISYQHIWTQNNFTRKKGKCRKEEKRWWDYRNSVKRGELGQSIARGSPVVLRHVFTYANGESHE